MTNRDIPVTDALAHDGDWREAYKSALNSLNEGHLAGWEMDLLRRRVEAALTIQGDTGDGLVERAVNTASALQSWQPAKHHRDFARAAVEYALALSTRPPVDVEAVRDALWNHFCPGIRRTEADDTFYGEAAKAAIAALAPRSSGEGSGHE